LRCGPEGPRHVVRVVTTTPTVRGRPRTRRPLATTAGVDG
jgi:hypothetical protein